MFGVRQDAERYGTRGLSSGQTGENDVLRSWLLSCGQWRTIGELKLGSYGGIYWKRISLAVEWRMGGKGDDLGQKDCLEGWEAGSGMVAVGMEGSEEL